MSMYLGSNGGGGGGGDDVSDNNIHLYLNKRDAQTNTGLISFSVLVTMTTAAVAVSATLLCVWIYFQCN